jgi:hypothetical protein
MGLAAHFRHRHMVRATTHRKTSRLVAIVAFGFAACFAFASAPVVP